MNVLLIVIWSFYSALALFTVVGSESDGGNNAAESPAAEFTIGT